MKQDDIYIESLLDLLNLRFAPNEDDSDEWIGGLSEMVSLQKSFQIFQEGRSFKDSCAILDLGGFWNGRTKYRWFKLLESLDKTPANIKGFMGGAAIVDAIMKNLASRNPRPMYFTAHDMRPLGAYMVMIDIEPRPIFYIDREYLTVSLPMKPKPKDAGAKKKKK